MQKMGWFGVCSGHSRSWAMPPFDRAHTTSYLTLIETTIFRWCGRRLLDGHAGSAIKVLVAIHYSVLDARNGYIRNVVV